MCAKQTGRIYYTMGEVTEMFDVNPSLIRFWESKFDILKPHKNKKGNRLFTPSDVENLKLIYHLVKEKGMTLSGAQKQIKTNREGINRDMEVIDRLLGIKALLAEIKQELNVGADFESDPEEDHITEAPMQADTAAVPSQGEAEAGQAVAPETISAENDLPAEYAEKSKELPQAVQETYVSPLDNLFFGEKQEEIPDYEDIPDPDDDEPLSEDPFENDLGEQPVNPPISEQVQQIVSQNITEIAGGEFPEEYIGELSDEIADEAATAAEVMEALAELDKVQEKKQGPTVYEQTLF